MSLRFIDSFDHYDTPHALAKWTQSVTNGFAINTSFARTGRAAMGITASGITKTIDRQTTWIIGHALYATTFAWAIQVLDGDGGVQAGVDMNNDGTWNLRRGGPPLGPVIGTSDPKFAMHTDRYYFVEWKLIIGGTGAGYSELRLNGQVIAVASGVNTQASTNTYGDQIQFSGPGGGGFNFMDDLYICDGQALTTGSNDNNDFLGDCRVGVIMPNGTGDATALTPFGTATVGTNTFVGTNWRDTNEKPPDDDSTYVFSTATTSHDLYNFEDINPSVIVKGVQSNMFARKDDEGNRGISLVSKPSIAGGAPATEFTSTNTYYVNLTYIDYLDQFDVNPATSTAWTATEVNASQWGPKVAV